LFSFRGRVSRELFWLGYPLALIYFLFGPSLILISIFGLGPSETPWAEASIFLAAALPAVWIGGAIGAKRFHDRGKSGWLMIIFGAGPILSIGAAYTLAELIIPKYGLPEVFEPIYETVVTTLLILGGILFWWGVVELGFLKGTDGLNRFGPPP
jgi:uncharacterized membrane protein YhaH (DUF805 family)